MKTQGEIEASICAGITRFEQDYMGRGPKDIHAHLLGDLLVVRLKGVLTAAEQQLVKSLPAEKRLPGEGDLVVPRFRRVRRVHGVLPFGSDTVLTKIEPEPALCRLKRTEQFCDHRCAL